MFNKTVEHQGDLGTAGGTPKSVETELPAGFIGDPQDATKCTAAQVQKHVGTPAENTACPSDSAVGFVQLGLGGRIEHGVANPHGEGAPGRVLVYDMEPSPGHAAAFGFVFLDAFFGLNATLRSDGTMVSRSATATVVADPSRAAEFNP